MTERRLRDDALAIWRAGVDAVHARELTWNAVEARLDDLIDSTRIAVVGAGKATTAMAQVLGDMEIPIAAGWVNVPDATVVPVRGIHVHGARKLPDNRPTAEGVEGSKQILAIARSLDAGDLLVVLISGGGSALLPLPVGGVTLDEKLVVTKLLQEAGATIDEMNCVRKHLSQIKGGRLAQATRARVLTLIVSDVIGDPLDVIASGPTAPDPTTFADAWGVLGQHGVLLHVPGSVRRHLEAGMDGRIEETPKESSDRVTNVVIGNNETARRAARALAERRGYAVIDAGIVDGDTGSAGRTHAAQILAASPDGKRPLCIVSGGETTVNLGGAPGKGGRNQEFALTVLSRLGAEGLTGVCVLCGGTDGEDGPTDAAGAIADEEIARAAEAKGLDPADFLHRHDAYRFFAPLGGLVKTGPTNTNVMDLRVTLIDRTAGATVGASVAASPRSLQARAEPG